MSSILKTVPEIQRIFLCTRITNTIAQHAYKNWGFTDEQNPQIEEHAYTFNPKHWIFMEYKVNENDVLQQVMNRIENNKSLFFKTGS